MQALRVTRIGTAPQLASLDLPAPERGEVQVGIAACALNFADLLMIEGRYQDTPPVPFTLGLELSGHVIGCGAGVEGLSPGQKVAVYGGQGGLAEAGNFPAARVIALPEGLDLKAAAALQVAHGTAHLALACRAGLRPGETVVILGAVGGAGLAAVEVAHLLGARVIAVARGSDRLNLARAAGADMVMDAETPDLRQALKAAGPIDVIYDAVGGATGAAAFRALRPGGRFLVIGFAGGGIPELPLNHALVKNISILGVNWGGYLRLDPTLWARSLAAVFDWAAEGRLRPHIGAELPLAEAPRALEMLRARAVGGKILVLPDAPAGSSIA
ncbi:NADPH:quinone oxidoreductase family protein [Phaeovulum vinaykumarii]|uniref:NADPH2:quinone reductase n=1 Tax=Phaeovulum vinaykumarii TaxID=407234 RepID=A0A1N7JYU1_9RHOB|nr:NADPH:quinone oxidoreductase family protein [Phaeovulum vinaykumarii]SIS54471.1 NADPH2:quinone reductase [Phaeovulum vinaykumarii]SOB91949.1 NADPH:quinone reductase-like Zn-dependent oxidoreductase [Phaeovulum vinaykumarii]